MKLTDKDYQRGYTISVFKHHDATVILHAHIDGEWWHEFIIADSVQAAERYTETPHLSSPGISYANRFIRLHHPKKVVLFQAGGLDI
jgi:hypothetical protein